MGRIFGIQVQVHWTFLLLVGYIALVDASAGATAVQVFEAIALVLAVFACVVLHEFGHALTARRYGINTRDITLLPIGGVARLERMPDDPTQEFLVAVAGPAVNVAIAGILYGGLKATGAFESVGEVAVVGGNLIVQLMWINVLLVAFNLLPAFPMDGGRILRALLSYRLSRVRATRVASRIGQGMAILFGVYGIMSSNYVLAFIAVFVFFGAQAEAREVEMGAALSGWSVGDAMMTRFRALTPDSPLEEAVREVLAGAQQDFPVLAGEHLAGMLLRGDLTAALETHPRDTPVGSVMRQDVSPVQADDDLGSALNRMRQRQHPCLPVLRGEALVGLLTVENLGEFLRMNPPAQGNSARRVGLAEIFSTE